MFTAESPPSLRLKETQVLLVVEPPHATSPVWVNQPRASGSGGREQFLEPSRFSSSTEVVLSPAVFQPPVTINTAVNIIMDNVFQSR